MRSNCPKSGKCHYLIVNEDITNKSVELDKKTLHTETEQKLKIFKARQSQLQKQLIQVKCPYQSRTVYEWFNQKILFNSFI